MTKRHNISEGHVILAILAVIIVTGIICIDWSKLGEPDEIRNSYDESSVPVKCEYRYFYDGDGNGHMYHVMDGIKVSRDECARWADSLCEREYDFSIKGEYEKYIECLDIYAKAGL